MTVQIERRVEYTREKIAAWIAAFDTRISEFAMGALAIGIGIGNLAFTKLPTGLSVAPVLQQTLSFLSSEPSVWAGALMATGVLVLIGLGIGTRNPINTWPRAWVNWLLCCFFIAIAIGSGQQVSGSGRALIYGILASVTAWNTLVLTVEAGIQKANLRIERRSMLEIDRRTVSRNEMPHAEVQSYGAE